jgi:hypothetical protein
MKRCALANYNVPADYSTITDAYDAAKAAVLSTSETQTVVIAAGDYIEFPSVVDVSGVDFVGPSTGDANVIATALFDHFTSSPSTTYSNSVTNVNFLGVRLTGSEFQKLYLNNVTCINDNSDCLIVSNTGVDSGTNKHSFVKAVNCTFVANDGAALNMTGGFVDAVKCSFTSPTDGVSVSIDFSPVTDKVAGLKLYQGSITGQVQARYGNLNESDYFMVNLDKVSIRTTGNNYSCISLEDASIKLLNVVLNNPQSSINIQRTGNSFVSYKNLTVPAGIVPPNFATLIPRNRIEPDIVGAGGVLLNDSYGKISSVRGISNGHSLVWSSAKDTWESSEVIDALKVYDFYVDDISLWVAGDVVALTPTGPVLAQNDSEEHASVVGVVYTTVPSTVSSGGTIAVLMAGYAYLNTNLSSFSRGQHVYVGPVEGKVVGYSSLQLGKWISDVGTVIDPANNIIAYQPRLIGIK